MEENVQVRLQKIILWGLASRGLFSRYVLHGGSSLYFFWKGIRWSEDLDLVKNQKHNASLEEDLQHFEKALKEVGYLTPTFFSEVKEVEVRLQKKTSSLLRFIFKAFLKGERCKARVHVKVANVPAYRIVVKPLERVLVAVEDPLEIMADKIVSLVARALALGKPKPRDVIDIHFLGTAKDLPNPSSPKTAKEVATLVFLKFKDYGISPENFDKGLKSLQRWLGSPEAYSALIATFPKYALPSAQIDQSLLESYCEEALKFARCLFSEGPLLKALKEKRAQQNPSSKKLPMIFP